VDLRQIFAPRNRGILLDVIVFLINLVLMRFLTRLSMDLVDRAEYDDVAKAVVGFYFAGVFFLQPLGPILKRWSAHQRKNVDTEWAIGCFLIWFMFFYLVMMICVSGTAVIILTEVFVEQGSPASEVGTVLVLGGALWSVFNAVVIYRYFLTPKRPPRWRFLMTTRAAILGDVFMFLNVIALQILWNSLTAAPSFWSHMLSTPLGRPGSFTDILGRFIVIGTLALLVYFPGRIFYLVEDGRRKVTWLTMLLANLPLLVRAIVATR